MIKTIFFDLDWTILNSEPLYGMFGPILKIVESSGASEEFKERFRKSLRGLTDAKNLNELTSEEIKKIYDTYLALELPENAKSYGDENCILELNTTNFLISTGFRRTQMEKIEKLNIAHMFEEIYIDEINEDFQNKGKEYIFREIIGKYTLLPHEILVVGDKGRSELTAGKNIGAKTAQIVRPKIKKWEGADYYVHSLCEIKDLL
jgi:phosphoglycolate phosphatase-like HAD superfamily hydrolase